jgi:RNA polymerase sigma-54 factor
MESISLIQDNQISQNQQLVINLAMRQAFHVLQLPLLELSGWMKNEIENNPVLELDLSKESFKESFERPTKEHTTFRNRSQEALEKQRKQHQENLLTSPVSLYEHLMKQIPLAFEDKQDLYIAEILIGHLNEKGYLDTPLEQIIPSTPLETLQRVLQVLQTLDPPGIAAANLQECLLLQLKLKQKENSLAAKIIADHFEALIENRHPQIAQQLQIPLSELSHLIKTEVAPLDLYPGRRFYHQPIAAIIPDLIFLCIEGKWQIEINTSFLPRFHIAPIYADAIKNNTLKNQEHDYLQRKLTSGRWLKKMVQRRNQTLKGIGEFLLKRQMPFFNAEKASLVPITLSDVANHLGLHESTIARAVANKYLACPLGVFSLKSFFNQGISTQNGQKISNRSLREILAQTIEKEDKSEPLSDAKLAQHFKKIGIPCARRTIAKYRNTLRISSAAQRKKWS